MKSPQATTIRCCRKSLLPALPQIWSARKNRSASLLSIEPAFLRSLSNQSEQCSQAPEAPWHWRLGSQLVSYSNLESKRFWASGGFHPERWASVVDPASLSHPRAP